MSEPKQLKLWVNRFWDLIVSLFHKLPLPTIPEPPSYEPPKYLYPSYEEKYAKSVVNFDKITELLNIRSRILANQNEYEIVERATGVPWKLVGCLHYRETEPPLSFKGHLHNGDPLTARTIHEPIGRPLIGEPPFDWHESAIDALKMKRMPKDWSIGGMLWYAERYNGMGYWFRDIESPYLFGWTNLYTKGGFPEDHVWSDTYVNKQPGVAAMLKYLLMEV